MTDPDRGNETYTYDSDGNLTKSVDARGGAGTIYVDYDGLDRPIWRNTSNSPTGAYDTYSYDSTSGGNFGIGQLTSESFSGAGLNGARAGEPTNGDNAGDKRCQLAVLGGTQRIRSQISERGESICWPQGCRLGEAGGKRG